MKKTAVIMLQPMGGVGVNYVTGQEVLVPNDVAEAWEKGEVARIKKGKPSDDAVVHPDPIESHEDKARREEAEAMTEAGADQAVPDTNAEAEAAQAGGAP